MTINKLWLEQAVELTNHLDAYISEYGKEC